MAFVLYFDSSGNPEFFCSGTLVSSNLVLTAGHCAVDETTGSPLDPASYRVVTGAVDWSNTTTRQVSTVSKVIVYPSFDPSTLDHDAALLQLSSPVSGTSVGLWGTGELDGGTGALIAGWGLTNPSDAGPDTFQLRWTNTVVQSETYCSQEGSSSDYAYDSSSELCAIEAPSHTTSVCNGDSGGPLLVQSSSGTWIEVGITSISLNSCDTQLPDYFTAVQPISSWVDSWIEAAELPTITAAPASSVEQTTAQLNGELNPNGSPTTYYFQWGTSTAYGDTSRTGSTNSGRTLLPVSVVVTGLTPGTTYHYRVVATNANGTSYGTDQTFTTSAPASPAPEYGRYNGTTSQGWPIHIRVGTNAAAITAVSFSFTLRCTNHRPVSYSIAAGDTPWPLDRDDGLGFSHSFLDSTGTRYNVTGTFTTSGSARGTLTAHGKTHKLGTCGTGNVHWTAH